MEILSRFNKGDFEVWVDHLQYLDLGERHQSVPSGKSYIRGAFDREQDAYVIEKIHIDPDMFQTDIKEELLHEAKLQANKRDKKLLKEKRVAAMPKVHEPRMRMERNQAGDNRPMVRRDIQTAVWRIADSLARALKEPQEATPGDARWTVSGLSHSSWAINHPDLMTDGESPLTLRVKKLPNNSWMAYGQNRLTNLSNIETLALRETPPGGEDWDDLDNLARTAATYFQKQKANILSLKQEMTPETAPGAGAGGQPQQGGEGGGMGGGMGGMMASRRARRRTAVEMALTPQQAMIALGIQGTGDFAKDHRQLQQIALKSHPDVREHRDDSREDPFADIRMKAANVLMETFTRKKRPLPRTAEEAAQAQTVGQGATVGGAATASQVNQKVQEFVSTAIRGVYRLQQTFSTPNAPISPRAAVTSLDNLKERVHAAAVTTRNLGAQGTGLYQRLMGAYHFLQVASEVLQKSGNQINSQALDEVKKNLNGFSQMAHAVLDSTGTKQANRRDPEILASLRRTQRISRQIQRTDEDRDWYARVMVSDDQDGIGSRIPGASRRGHRRVVGGARTAGRVQDLVVQNFLKPALKEVNRLVSTLTGNPSQITTRSVTKWLGELSDLVHQAMSVVNDHLGTDNHLYMMLASSQWSLGAAFEALSKVGSLLNENAIEEVKHTMEEFVHTAHEIIDQPTDQRTSRRASATLDTLRRAQRIARQIHRSCDGQSWFLGVRVINDRNGIGLGVGAGDVPPRSLRASLEGIPVVLEGPGARMIQAQQENQKHLRLARKLAQGIAQEIAEEVAEEMEIDPAAEKTLRHHQRMVKRVYNHIKNSKRLSGSVRYLARKLGIDFSDLVKVIGQLIVEGKIEMTKKKKFRPLPEPHSPVPGMENRFSSTNSVFGIDRGRSDKRVDQLMSTSVYQLNTDEHRDGDDAATERRDIRERPSKMMPDPTQPN